MKSFTPPPDKSITIRALLLAAAAPGRTVIINPLFCGDTEAAMTCLRQLGARIKFSEKKLVIESRGLQSPSGPLQARGSGTLCRLLAGLLAGRPFPAVITGNAQLSRRPMARLALPLNLMGARISLKRGGLPIKTAPSELKGIKYTLPVASAQLKSALLLAGLRAAGSTSVTEPAPSRDHTERLLEYFCADIKRRGLTAIIRPGPLKPRAITIPGDISSAAPFITAAVLAGLPLKVRDVGLNPGRLGFIKALKRMGVKITVNLKVSAPEPAGDIIIRPGRLKAIKIAAKEVPAMIDELPLLALAASAAAGTTLIHGAGELRHKESDRISSTLALLKALGAEAFCEGDTLRIKGPADFKAAAVRAKGDHRIAMAAAAAAVLAGRVDLSGAACLEKSYPGFLKDFTEVFG